MAWTIESALAQKPIHQPRKLLSEYQFTLGKIPVLITIRLYKPIIGGTKVLFEQSHFIYTPVQAGPYETSRPWNNDEPSALHQAIFGYTENYNAAVRAGHTPDSKWLVPNKDF